MDHWLLIHNIVEKWSCDWLLLREVEFKENHGDRDEKVAKFREAVPVLGSQVAEGMTASGGEMNNHDAQAPAPALPKVSLHLCFLVSLSI